MKVTLYAICKNEQRNVEKFLKNAKKFDDVVVVDTGSEDETVQLLKDANIKVYEHPQTREEFDFSEARNQALSYVKTDWAFSLDFNEELDDFFPSGFEPIEGEFTTFNHLRFNEDEDEGGEPSQSHEVHTRFHRTENYKWIRAVHESPIFVPTEKYPQESSVDTTIKITKTIQKNISKELFYLSICEREYEKDSQNWFYLWFMFKHYYSVENIQKALFYGLEYLNITKPYFNPSRIDCFLICSQIFLKREEIQTSANYAFHALSEAIIFGGEILGKAFTHLLNLGHTINNPNIVIFASAFNQNTLSSPERSVAIDRVFLTHLDDIPSAWRGHRKFAEWLVRYLNPEVTVDLGVDHGFSTFCFAMPRIGHVYGIDSFEGDYYAGPRDNSAYEFVLYKKDKLHLGENVTFIKGFFDDVAKTWDKKIDILHIDGTHSYEAVKNDYKTWKKFLKKDGVILFHDTEIDKIEGRQYGVKKFFDEIKLPKINFTHTCGLGVVSQNEKLIEEIKNTFDLDNP